MCWSDPYVSDLVHLQDFTQLETLCITLRKGWSDTSRLHQLRTMTGLKTLEIGGRQTTDERADWSGLAVLAALPNLQRLRLHGITDGGLAHLPQLPQLEVLDLSGSAVDGSGLRHLDDMPQLQALSLNRSAITDSGLASLRAVPQLEELRLDGNPFHDGGFYNPAVCGHEWSGTISALGCGVEGLSEGDRVGIGVAPACGRCAECRAAPAPRSWRHMIS